MYYTVVNDKEFISASKEALEELYTDVYVLPDDYEYRKYIVSPETHQLVPNPNWEEEKAQAERERLNMLSLTKREVFLALYKDKGITPEQLRAQIQDTEALIEFDYAELYYRGNPLIDSIGLMLGYTSKELDYLFEHKEFPKSSEG